MYLDMGLISLPIGRVRGMKPFVDSAYFKELKVAIDIDEGGGNLDSESMKIRYGGKSLWGKFIFTKRFTQLLK